MIYANLNIHFGTLLMVVLSNISVLSSFIDMFHLFVILFYLYSFNAKSSICYLKQYISDIKNDLLLI